MGKYFNYPHTCPKIDKNIRNFNSELSNHLNTLVEELNPMFFNTVDGSNFVEQWFEIIQNSAEPCFEDTRQFNSNMRDEVEKVVEEIVEERDEYKRLYEFWQDDAEEKDKQIEDLKEEIENLKYQIENLIGV